MLIQPLGKDDPIRLLLLEPPAGQTLTEGKDWLDCLQHLS